VSAVAVAGLLVASHLEHFEVTYPEVFKILNFASTAPNLVNSLSQVSLKLQS